MTGEKLKAAREAAGLTRKALAASLGVAYRTVYGWETEDRAPEKALRPKLREVLQGSPPLRKQRGKTA